MTDEEREREYSPSSCLPNGDYRPFVEAYVSESEAAWSRLDEHPDIATTTLRYGGTDSHTIDVAIPETADAPPPLLVFIHGGYWQELSKAESRFAAWDCVERGWAFAAVDYTLAPLATLDGIVEECRRAVATLHDLSATLGVDPNRIFVAGSSAGAHLAAMVAIGDETQKPIVRGVVLVSGIFELEPLIGTSVNDALNLDAATATQNSPLQLSLDGFPPSLMFYGENETAEFKAQSIEFADRLEDLGTAAATREIAGRNHFDVILDLAKPHTELGDAVGDFIEATGDTHANF